jgi:TPR repeat protein
VPKDYARAVSWFRKAAEKNDAEGQRNLGTMYRDGLGVKKDYALAATWYRRAAEQGYEDAKKKLAELQQHQRAETAANSDKIPPAIHFKCILEAATNKTNNPNRYDECLRSNWKQLMGSEPFPGN